MSAKETALELIRALPDEVTEQDILSELHDRLEVPESDGEEFTDEEWEAEWLPEIERRVADFRAGKTVGIPAEEVLRQLREKYG